MCVVGDAIGDAADEETRHSREPAPPDDDKIGTDLPRRIDNGFRRMSSLDNEQLRGHAALPSGFNKVGRRRLVEAFSLILRLLSFVVRLRMFGVTRDRYELKSRAEFLGDTDAVFECVSSVIGTIPRDDDVREHATPTNVGSRERAVT